MPLFIQYMTLLSAQICYIRLTLQNSSTVKTYLTHYSEGVQVLLVLLKFRNCSLRMLSQDLLFLLCLPLPYQSSHQSLFTSSQVLCKNNFFYFFRVFNMSLSETQTHCAFRLVFWTASTKFMLPLKWNEVTCSSLMCLLLFCSSLVYC